jgi:hypothetical protein
LVKTEIAIDAPPARVWEVLTDFSGYRVWNPVIRRAEGRAELDAPLRLWLGGPGGRTLEVRARIEECTPERSLGWRGGVPHLADVYHFFRLEPLADGGTRFIHGERFDGVASRLVWPLLGPLLRPRYHLSNEAFRTRCEAGP